MIYDELIEELALTLLTKARYEGCISVIDGFSQCEEDKTRIEYAADQRQGAPLALFFQAAYAAWGTGHGHRVQLA